MNILVITDNQYIFENFNNIIKNEKYKDFNFKFFYSYKNKEMKEKYFNSEVFKDINIKN